MKYLIAIAFITISSLLSAQTSIPYYDQEITADGSLTESIWVSIPSFSDFQNYFPINDGAASMDTEVKIYHDGKYLNVAYIYHDTLAEVRVNSLKRDNYGAGFHNSDAVGLVIDPYNDQNRGYLFSVNGRGAQMDALIANYDNENLSWDAIWESGTSVSGTDKVYEMKIPLSVFSFDENIDEWSFQFYTRDAKDRMYTVWNKFERGFLQFDTRFLKRLTVEEMKPIKTARTIVIPALTAGYQKDIINDSGDSNLQPSLDLQYKLTDGLRVDATINPDFSQVEVDQQVTNLTRFNIIFPERRNFFIENSDMFTTIGVPGDAIPFYSRFIGADEDIAFGVKLSGNATKSTRIGLLNVQGKKNDSKVAQNYTVASLRQQFSPVINATGYLINRQNTDGLSLGDDYNRILGLKTNYLSKNKKWSGFATVSCSYNDGLSGDNLMISLHNQYQTRTLSFFTRYNRIGKNYMTDIGFVPRLYNYDAETGEVIRESYSELYQEVTYNYFPEDQSVIQSYRPIFFRANLYFDDEGDLFEKNFFFNNALYFANQTSIYVNYYHDDVKLKYAFDPLRNGNLVLPGEYKNRAVRAGFNSDYTRDVFGSINAQYGSFYEGRRTRFGINGGYRLLPLLSLQLNYEYNNLSFDEQGDQGVHLVGLTAEVFFNNQLNWTTYLQYNEQINNFNINTRLQWEYRPLSFIYLVYSDNYTESFGHKNWGVSFKVNRRLQF